MLKKIIKGCWEYFAGHICATVMYDKKYVSGRYFKGKRRGFLGRGWRWAIDDGRARRKLGVNRGVPFPISVGNRVNHPLSISFHPDDLQIFQGNGKYFQAEGAEITIGKGCHIANNVGIITTNHNLSDPDEHLPGKAVVLGEKCWIGMNAMILPGVRLGEHTVVGAGSVVTKSFPEGWCVVAGNPARVIKQLEPKPID